jgi:hypothetical protein
MWSEKKVDDSAGCSGVHYWREKFVLSSTSMKCGGREGGELTQAGKPTLQLQFEPTRDRVFGECYSTGIASLGNGLQNPTATTSGVYRATTHALP